MSVLRELKMEDAPFMLEWMHDSNVNQWFQVDFSSKSIEDCIRFIRASRLDTESIHMAVINDHEEYMGTVSLKDIDLVNGTAEFAIAMRTTAHGTGLAAKAMREIISIGLYQKGLQAVYWNVFKSNDRAIKFYDKSGYLRCPPPANKPHTGLLWYKAEETLEHGERR